MIRVGVTKKLVRGGEADAHQDEKGFDAIAPGQLLALLPATGRIVDRDLVNPVSESQDAAGDLGLDVEPATAQAKPRRG